MNGRRVRFHRLQQFLVAFAALGMLVGVRPASAVRGHLVLKPVAVTSITMPVVVETSLFESGPAESLVSSDCDEDESDETETESTDSESTNLVEMERGVAGRSAPARSRLPLLCISPFKATLPARLTHLRLIAVHVIPDGLPIFLCRLTC